MKTYVLFRFKTDKPKQAEAIFINIHFNLEPKTHFELKPMFWFQLFLEEKKY